MDFEVVVLVDRQHQYYYSRRWKMWLVELTVQVVRDQKHEWVVMVWDWKWKRLIQRQTCLLTPRGSHDQLQNERWH
jgi:hypothetical protein